jgi:hypothetical protein
MDGEGTRETAKAGEEGCCCVPQEPESEFGDRSTADAQAATQDTEGEEMTLDLDIVFGFFVGCLIGLYLCGWLRWP